MYIIGIYRNNLITNAFIETGSAAETLSDEFVNQIKTQSESLHTIREYPWIPKLFLVSNETERDMNIINIIQFLTPFSKHLDSIAEISVLNNTGLELIRIDISEDRGDLLPDIDVSLVNEINISHETGNDKSSEKYFTNLVEKEKETSYEYISNIYLNVNSKGIPIKSSTYENKYQPVIIHAMSINSENGQFFGILMLKFFLQKAFNHMSTELQGIFNESQLAFIDDNGDFLFNTDGDEWTGSKNLNKGISFDKKYNLTSSIISKKKNVIISENKVFVSTKLPIEFSENYKVFIIATLPTNVITNTIDTSLLTILLIMLLSGLVGTVFVIFLIRTNIVRKLTSVLIEDLAESIITINKQGNIELFNKSAEKIFGYSKEEVVGENIKLIIPEPYASEHDEYNMNFLQTSVKKLIGIGREFIALKKDKTVFPINLSVSEFIDINNEIKFICLIKDLTEVKKQETLLKLSRKRFELFPDGILLFDFNGCLIKANKAVIETYNSLYNQSIFVTLGKNSIRKLDPQNEFISSLKNVFEGTPIEKTIQDDKSRTFLNIKRFDSELGVYIVIYDVSKSVELNQIRSRIISTVSHELRSPITSIIQSLNNYKKYKDQLNSEKKEKLIEMASRNSLILLEIVEDLLFIFKSDQSPVGTEWKQCNLSQILTNVIQHLNPQIKASKINIHKKFTPEIKLLAIPKQIRQIFRVFLDNAIKYSPKNSEIMLEVTEEYQGIYNPSNQDGLLIEIRDYGIGIPKKDQKNLFNEYFRASNVQNKSGTGLGLSIAKKLIEYHKGNISVESEKGQGTSFFIFLPIAKD